MNKLLIPIVETVLNTDDRPSIEFTSALNFRNPNQGQELGKIVTEWLKLKLE